MNQVRADAVAFTEAEERSWREYLTDFQRDVYPMFQEAGLTLYEALTLWELNRQSGYLKRIVNRGF